MRPIPRRDVVPVRGPLDTDLIVTRIRAEVTAFREVAGAAEFQEALKSTCQTPSVFVVLAQETSQKAPGGSSVAIQEVRATVSVILAVQNYKASRGNESMLEARPMIQAVRKAMKEWSPHAEARPFHFVSGRLLSFQNAVLWWEERYELSYWSRSDEQ